MLPDVLKLWQQTPVNSIRLLNAYGPTETTITATAYEVASRPGEKTRDHRVPIRRPLANRAIYVFGPTQPPRSDRSCRPSAYWRSELGPRVSESA